MSKLRLAIFILCLLTMKSVPSAQSVQIDPSRKYDEFIESNCEDMMARLDNYAIALQNEPKMQAFIVSYGGSLGLPEARRWAVAAKKYLTYSRGIEAKRIVTLYGGNRDRRALELWLLSDAYRTSAPGTQSVRPKGVKFKKSRTKYRPCNAFF